MDWDILGLEGFFAAEPVKVSLKCQIFLMNWIYFVSP